MTGVEILSASKVIVDYAFNWELYFIVAAGITAVMTLISCFMDDFCFESVIIGLITGVVFGAIIATLPAATTIPSEYETQYKITVSDEVLMNEFLDRYEIIDQDGKIYTVRERDD